MNNTNAYEMKNIGSRVKNYDVKKWTTVSAKAAYTADLAKFSENDNLKGTLMSTEDLILGEATRDRFWGIRLPLWEKTVKLYNTWIGENLSGKTLMKVRANLR